MNENILNLGTVFKSTFAQEIISEISNAQKEIINKTGSASRIAFCEASNSLLPLILSKCGLYICIFSNKCKEIPDNFCYISSGTDRVLAKRLKADETIEAVEQEINSFWETLPDFPVFAAESLGECKFEEIEKNEDIFISEKNIKLCYFGKCIDGSGDTVLRVFENSEENGADETRAFISSDALDCGFWFDIRNGEIKTFRIGKHPVRETDFCEGIIPFNEMID